MLATPLLQSTYYESNLNLISDLPYSKQIINSPLQIHVVAKFKR